MKLVLEDLTTELSRSNQMLEKLNEPYPFLRKSATRVNPWNERI
jgi:hypothetical protein